MTKYIVQGGKPLFGEVEISGAKNAAVAIIPAALLVDGVCRIENIPQISDVTMCLKILEDLGANVRTINRHTVEIDCTRIRSTRTNYELSRKIRASYYNGHTKGTWGDPANYDMVLDVGRVGIEKAARIIAQAVQLLDGEDA